MDTTKIFSNQEKSITIQFVKDWENSGKYLHSIEVVNPLVYGCINNNFLIWGISKAIRHFIGFLDYSKEIEFAVYENICGLRLCSGKVYTTEKGIRFITY